MNHYKQIGKQAIEERFRAQLKKDFVKMLIIGFFTAFGIVATLYAVSKGLID